ncbi:MAG: hypothetical protein AAFR21_05150 [Pseudomonadota bacterium]
MKDTRSASQILFGFLPEQTVDIKAGIWKVRNWNTYPVYDVDLDALRQALIANAGPWEAAKRDGNYVRYLRSGAKMRVETLDRDQGVYVEPFPRTWKCDNCNRLHDKPDTKCQCGSSRHGQLPFVLYHDACGDIREPYYARCKIHKQARINLPGTTSLYEITLDCPVCNQKLSTQFLNSVCRCGEQGQNGDKMDFNVHRGATVYTPRGVVIVNPPSTRQSKRLRDAGGAPTAAVWIAEGLKAPWVDKMTGGRAAALRRTLADSGLEEDAIERMIEQSGLDDDAQEPLSAAPAVIERVESEASSIALAMSETRQTISDLTATAKGSMAKVYSGDYLDALEIAGIERVDLIERFPVLTGQYGFSRGDHEPGATRLRAFQGNDGSYVVYGDVAATEALYIRLDPDGVARWLTGRGMAVELGGNKREAYQNILTAMGPDPDASPVFEAVETLIHSYSHRMVRQSSFYAGIDRNALSELLFPTTLSFVTYAVPRGDFVLGGLQAMFEYDLHTVLGKVVFDESRCALDPGCASNPNGASCAVCLHVGEPSCRMFNTCLDRKTLFGTEGYFESLTHS